MTGVIYLFGHITREEMQNSIDFIYPLKDHIYSNVYDQVVTKVTKSNDGIHWCQTSDEMIHDECIITVARSLI
jgi:hypothetical protein